MTKLLRRSELPQEETWDLTLLYKDQKTYEKALDNYERAVEDFQKFKGQLNSDATLTAAFKALEQLLTAQSRLGAYASLAYEVDKQDPLKESNLKQMMRLFDRTGEKLSFFESELLAEDPSFLEGWVQSEAGQDYAPYIQQLLRSKAHRLSPDCEALLDGLKSHLFNQYQLHNTYKYQDLTFDDFEVAGQRYPLSYASFEGDFEVHVDPAIRRQAWQTFHQGLARYQNIAAEIYISHVESEKAIATRRGFESVFDYLLHDQQVSRQAYDQQIDLLMEKFGPVMQRYAKTLQKAHHLDQITLADIKIALPNSDLKTITPAESQTMIEQGLAGLGQEYLEIIQEAFAKRWIDYPMNLTKTTGGFCATVAEGPSYILLNWTGLMNEVLVLAHELGHAGHFQLSQRYQNITTPEASLYFIEAPSTANEVIMFQYLLANNKDPQRKMSLIGEFIARTYFHNMVTHLLEAAFQRKVYQAVDEGLALNASHLNQFFIETLEAFWQGALTINEGAELTWMRQPHYYMGLYSYTYSAGLSIGTHIGKEIVAGNQAVITSWLEVLKAGGSRGPLELAQLAGVDMTTTAVFQETIDYVASLVDELDQYYQ